MPRLVLKGVGALEEERERDVVFEVFPAFVDGVGIRCEVGD